MFPPAPTEPPLPRLKRDSPPQQRACSSPRKTTQEPAFIPWPSPSLSEKGREGLRREPGFPRVLLSICAPTLPWAGAGDPGPPTPGSASGPGEKRQKGDRGRSLCFPTRRWQEERTGQAQARGLASHTASRRGPQDGPVRHSTHVRTHPGTHASTHACEKLGNKVRRCRLGRRARSRALCLLRGPGAVTRGGP